MVIEILESRLNELNDILSIKSPPNLGSIPKEVVVLAKTRGGMSAFRAANKVYEKKKELGLPTGNLPDGSANFDDILWLAFAEAIIEEITVHSKITSTSSPGIQIVAAGGNAGGPIVVNGQSITFSDGASIIE
jgi:hypothetical protein